MKKSSNNLKGILYILSGMFVIAFHDISLKILSINTNLFFPKLSDSGKESEILDDFCAQVIESL